MISRNNILFNLVILIVFISCNIFAQKATIMLSNKIKLELYSSNFNPSEHKIHTCKILDWKGICLIDNKPIFGTDFGMPKSQLDSAIIETNNKKIYLNVTCMYNPWFGKIDKKFFKLQNCEGGFFVTGYFSDAAGSYIAQWKIISNISIRTIISQDERIIFPFIEGKDYK